MSNEGRPEKSLHTIYTNKIILYCSRFEIHVWNQNEDSLIKKNMVTK